MRVLSVISVFTHRATACDIITHRNQCKIHFRMASKTRGTNVHHTRATVYTIAILVCEEMQRYGPTKQVIEFEFAMWK